MHNIKSQAKREAWNDPRNPFSKWRPNRNNTQVQMEEGLARRTQTAPGPTPLSNGEHDLNKREYVTDPTSRSRNVDGDDLKFSNELQQVNSPYTYSERGIVDKKTTANRTESDRTSSTEVPINNPTTSTSYQNGEDEKKHHRLHMPGFLGHKKDKEEDYNNGKDKKANGPHFTFWGQFRAVIFGSWVNVLLIFSPIGIALHFAKANEVAIFVVNFIAIIPLAGTLSYATEEIALRTGEVLGGLLNASFGYANSSSEFFD